MNKIDETKLVKDLLASMYVMRQKDLRTNAEIERAACVVQGTLNRIKKGKAVPRLDTVLKLLNQFDYTLRIVKNKRGAIMTRWGKNA